MLLLRLQNRLTGTFYALGDSGYPQVPGTYQVTLKEKSSDRSCVSNLMTDIFQVDGSRCQEVVPTASLT